MRLLGLALSREVTTVDWPRQGISAEGPPRGIPEFDQAGCTTCGECVDACPSLCLSLGEGDATPVVDAGSCVRCGHCVEACGEAAVTLTGDALIAAYSRDDLVMDGSPPGEVGLGPSPSRIYRMAADPRERKMVGPSAILEARASVLLRGERR